MCNLCIHTYFPFEELMTDKKKSLPGCHYNKSGCVCELLYSTVSYDVIVITQ